MPIPDSFELISFFETEPVVDFPDDGWEYNHLTFVVIQGNERLVCEMEPAELIFNLKWYDGETERFNLNLGTADGLAIEKTAGRELLRVTFSDNTGVLMLQLKPRIHIFIATKME